MAVPDGILAERKRFADFEIALDSKGNAHSLICWSSCTFSIPWRMLLSTRFRVSLRSALPRFRSACCCGDVAPTRRSTVSSAPHSFLFRALLVPRILRVLPSRNDPIPQQRIVRRSWICLECARTRYGDKCDEKSLRRFTWRFVVVVVLLSVVGLKIGSQISDADVHVAKMISNAVAISQNARDIFSRCTIHRPSS